MRFCRFVRILPETRPDAYQDAPEELRVPTAAPPRRPKTTLRCPEATPRRPQAGPRYPQGGFRRSQDEPPGPSWDAAGSPKGSGSPGDPSRRPPQAPERFDFRPILRSPGAGFGSHLPCIRSQFAVRSASLGSPQRCPTSPAHLTNHLQGAQSHPRNAPHSREVSKISNAIHLTTLPPRPFRISLPKNLSFMHYWRLSVTASCLILSVEWGAGGNKARAKRARCF